MREQLFNINKEAGSNTLSSCRVSEVRQTEHRVILFSSEFKLLKAAVCVAQLLSCVIAAVCCSAVLTEEELD